jgi:hypothetical protein
LLSWVDAAVFFLALNVTARLREIQHPACVLVGEKDVLKPPPHAMPPQ